MTKMLNVLEGFLNFHGHRYLRLDGTTKVEQRQSMMERFNQDRRIFVFILSTRSGGIGVNLTGADTVIFYDSDWNPTMDAQAQDRCHRIGQTRDVHIYRLISEKTIEENILKKANQKRLLGDVAIEGGNFTTAFFKQQTIKDLFEEPSGLEAFAKEHANDKKKDDLLSSDVKMTEKTKSPEKSRRDTKKEASKKETARAKKESVKFEESAKKVEKDVGKTDKDANLTQDQMEQALANAEDETDVMSVKVVKAEQKAELAEFDENIPWDEREAELRKRAEVSKVEMELAMLDKELTPVERYAVSLVELITSEETLEELEAAEEEVTIAKEEWQLSRMKELKEEEEMRAELEEDDMLFTYTQDDTPNNQVKKSAKSTKYVKKSAAAKAAASKRWSIASSEEYARMQSQLDIQRAAKITGQPLHPPRGRPSLGKSKKGKVVEGNKKGEAASNGDVAKQKEVLVNNNTKYHHDYRDYSDTDDYESEEDHEVERECAPTQTSTPLSSKGRGRGKTGRKRVLETTPKVGRPLKVLGRPQKLLGRPLKSLAREVPKIVSKPGGMVKGPKSVSAKAQAKPVQAVKIPTPIPNHAPITVKKVVGKPQKIVPNVVKSYKDMLVQKKLQAAKANVVQQKVPKPAPAVFIPSPDDGSRKSGRARRPSVRLDLESNLTDITSPKFARMYHSLLGGQLVIASTQNNVTTTNAAIQHAIQSRAAMVKPTAVMASGTKLTGVNSASLAGTSVTLGSVGLTSQMRVNKILPTSQQNTQLAASPKVVIQDISTAMKTGKFTVISQNKQHVHDPQKTPIMSNHMRTQSAPAQVQKQIQVSTPAGLSIPQTSQNVQQLTSPVTSLSVAQNVVPQNNNICTVQCDSTGQGILMTSDGTPLILNDSAQIIVQQSPTAQVIQAPASTPGSPQSVNVAAISQQLQPSQSQPQQPMKILLIQKPGGVVQQSALGGTPQVSQPQYVLTSNVQGKQIVSTSPTVQTITAVTKPAMIQQAKQPQLILNSAGNLVASHPQVVNAANNAQIVNNSSILNAVSPGSIGGIRTTRQIIQTNQGPVLATIQQPQQQTLITSNNGIAGRTIVKPPTLVQTSLPTQQVRVQQPTVVRSGMQPTTITVRATVPPQSVNSVRAVVQPTVQSINSVRSSIQSPSTVAVRSQTLSPPGTNAAHVVRLNQGRSKVNLATIAAHKSAVMGTVRQRLAAVTALKHGGVVSNASAIVPQSQQNLVSQSRLVSPQNQPRQVFVLPSGTTTQNQIIRTQAVALPTRAPALQQNRVVRLVTGNNNGTPRFVNASHAVQPATTMIRAATAVTSVQHNPVKPVPILEKLTQQLNSPPPQMTTNDLANNSENASPVKGRNLFQDIGQIT